MKKNRKTGFTLVELLVVIAIIALLLSILIPSMNRAKEIAKRVVCGSGLKGIGSAMGMYADAYDQLMPADGAVINGTYEVDKGHFYVVYRGGANDKFTPTFNPKTQRYAPLRWGCLFEKKYIADPKIFYCSGGQTPRGNRYDTYIDPPPWGTLPQNYNATNTDNQWVRIGYTYFPTDYTTKIKWDVAQTGQSYREPSCARFDKLDRSMPYASDLIWDRDGLTHKSGIRRAANNKVTVLNPGINAVFKDGHVVYCGDREVFTDNRAVPAGAVWWWQESGNLTLDAGRYAFNYTILKMVQP